VAFLKNLFIGRAKFNVFTVRAEELIEDRPELAAAVDRCSRHPWVFALEIGRASALHCEGSVIPAA
jgi:hypothetical protein